MAATASIPAGADTSHDRQRGTPEAGRASGRSPRRSAPAAALGTSRKYEPRSWWAGRRIRYRRRQTSSSWLIRAARIAAGLPETGDGWVRPPRPARCRWRVSEEVNLHHTEGSPAHWSGLERCGSVSACPVCSAVVRGRRAIEIQTAYAKKAYDSWVAEATKIGELYAAVARDAYKPVEQVVKKAPKPAAAA